MLNTAPKTFIFGHLRVKADQLSCGEGYGRAIDCLKVKTIYLIWKAMCF